MEQVKEVDLNQIFEDFCKDIIERWNSVGKISPIDAIVLENGLLGVLNIIKYPDETEEEENQRRAEGCQQLLKERGGIALLSARQGWIRERKKGVFLDPPLEEILCISIESFNGVRAQFWNIIIKGNKRYLKLRLDSKDEPIESHWSKMSGEYFKKGPKEVI